MSEKIIPQDKVSEALAPFTIFDQVQDAKAIFVFAHGAGADLEHTFMQQVAELLNVHKISVLRFNFNYMDRRRIEGSRRPPDRMPKLLICYKSMLIQLNKLNEREGLPVFIGGKSMGGRVAATIAAEDLSVLTSGGITEEVSEEISEENNVLVSSLLDKIKGVICLGYPFHPQKKPEKLRLVPLQQTQKPLLIIQGDRDALGDQTEINTYDFSPLCQVKFLQDGDHSFKPRVKSGFTFGQHIESAVKHMADFINENK